MIALQLPPRHGPWAWAYGRQSDKDAIDAGEGIPNQGSRTRAYWEYNLKPNGVEQFFFIPDDSAISARTNPFMLRHAGKTLMTLMKEGDHFIIDKVDRLWRSMEDFVDVMKMFKARGIILHICNMMGASITLGTPMGDAFMNIAITFAQLESDQCADRTRQRKRAMRQQGRFHSGRAAIPIGCAVAGDVERVDGRTKSNTMVLYWDPQYRAFMGEIVRLVDEEGKTAWNVARMIKTHFRTMFGEKFYHERLDGKGRGKKWEPLVITKHYWREKQYRALGDFDPNRVRFSIFNPPADVKFRDIGINEPNTPNPYPFLDGKPVPTAKELIRIGG